MTKVNIVDGNGNSIGSKEVLAAFQTFERFEHKTSINPDGTQNTEVVATGQFENTDCLVFTTGQMGEDGVQLVEVSVKDQDGIYKNPVGEKWTQVKDNLSNCAKGKTPLNQFQILPTESSVRVDGVQSIYLKGEHYDKIGESYKNAVVETEKSQVSSVETVNPTMNNQVMPEASITSDLTSFNSFSNEAAYSANDVIPTVDTGMINTNSQGFDINPDLIPVPDMSSQNNVNLSSDFVQDTSMNTISAFNPYNSVSNTSGVLETQTITPDAPQMNQEMGPSLNNTSFDAQFGMLVNKYTTQMNGLITQFEKEAQVLAKQYQDAMLHTQTATPVVPFPSYTEGGSSLSRVA